MARKPQLIKLSADELRSLKTSLTKGTTSARIQTRARILDLLHRQRAPVDISTVLGVGVATVFNIKRRYLAEGLNAALHDKPPSGQPCRIDGTARAKITALACSTAPAGHARWTLRLLADKAIELGFCDSISHSTVQEVLKKTTPAAPSEVVVHRGDNGRVPGADGRHPAPLQPAL
jgi:putative transposase